MVRPPPATVFATVFATALLWTTAALAQEEGEIEDEFALLLEEEKVFSAARHQQNIADSPSAITVITHEQIENSPCTDLPCLLRSVVEVDVKQVTSAWSVVGARAVTEAFYGDKTLLLVDGREFSIEVLGLPAWQFLPVHLEDIDRIEIIRGPGSALYGANAHSLVASITTRRLTEDRTEVFLAGGEHDSSSLNLRTGSQQGNWSLQLFGGQETVGSFRYPGRRDGELERLYLRLEHRKGSSLTTVQVGGMASELQCETGLGAARINNGVIGDFSVNHRNDSFRASASLSLYDADISVDLPLVFQGTTLGEFPDVLSYFSSSLDTEAQLTASPFEGNLFVAGASYRWSTLVSDDNDPSVTHQHRVGVFLHDEQRLLDRLQFTGGVRFDYLTQTPPSITPRVAVAWRFNKTHRLRLAFAMAFRKPCFFNTSLHVVGVKEAPGFQGLAEFIRSSIGNERLKNESVTVLESGYLGRFLDGRLTVEADIFFNRYRDTLNCYINIVTNSFGIPDLAASTMQYRNTGRDVDAVGGSLSLTYRIWEAWRLEANYTFRRSVYVSESVNNLGQDVKPTDKLVPEPAHLVNLSAFGVFRSGLRVGLSVHATGACDLDMPQNGGLFDPTIRVHGPAVLFASAFVSWRITTSSGWIEPGIRAFNVFGTSFRDVPAVARADGGELGGERLGRRVLLYLRGSLPGEK